MIGRHLRAALARLRAALRPPPGEDYTPIPITWSETPPAPPQPAVASDPAATPTIPAVPARMPPRKARA